MKIHFHRGDSPGWYYLAFGSFKPFKFLMHGGWFCLDLRWLWRFIYTVPKSRGWRWGK